MYTINLFDRPSFSAFISVYEHSNKLTKWGATPIRTIEPKAKERISGNRINAKKDRERWVVYGSHDE
jgi:hypothetical protein